MAGRAVHGPDGARSPVVHPQVAAVPAKAKGPEERLLECADGGRGLNSFFYVNRFYPKTQLSWLARLDHSHCNSADPLTDGLEVCCVFYRPGPGGAMCVVWWWKVLGSRGRGGCAIGG